MSSVVANGWSHYAVLQQVEKHIKDKDVVSKLIEDCINEPEEKWHFKDCLEWLNSKDNSSCGGYVSFWISGRTTSAYYMRDGRVEPYDSALERITKEYAKETEALLRAIFAKAHTREKLAMDYKSGLAELERYMSIQKHYDALALECRQKAVEMKKDQAKEFTEREDERNFRRKLGLFLVAIFWGVFLLFILWAYLSK